MLVVGLASMQVFFSTYIWPTRQKGTVLTSIQAGTTSYSQWWKISSLSSRPKPHPAHNDGRSLFFHPGRNHILPQWWKISIYPSRMEPHPATMIKGLCTSIHPGWNTSYTQWWKGLHSYPILEEPIPQSHHNGPHSLTELPGNWPGASILRMSVALTSDLLIGMANTHIWHGRNLIL